MISPKYCIDEIAQKLCFTGYSNLSTQRYPGLLRMKDHHYALSIQLCLKPPHCVALIVKLNTSNSQISRLQLQGNRFVASIRVALAKKMSRFWAADSSSESEKDSDNELAEETTNNFPKQADRKFVGAFEDSDSGAVRY